MNLAETQSVVKKALLFIALITFVYYTGKFIIIQGVGVYRAIFPQKLPEPAASYGLLPQLKMTNIQVDGTPQYILDTQNGRLPQVPDRIAVYKLVLPQTTLLSEQKIKQLAADLGFTGDSTKLTSSLFRWVDAVNTRTFQADAVSKNFKLDTPLFKLSNVVAQTPAITEEDAKSNVGSFLRSKLLISNTDANNLTYTTIPTQVTLGQIKEAKPISTNAKLMKVNAYINVIPAKPPSNNKDAKYIILGPNPKSSLINFTVTNNSSQILKYPLIEFTYWEPNYKESSEYYLAPLSDVWTAVQDGKGIVSYVEMDNGDYYSVPTRVSANRIEIRDVYLAYYMQPDYNSYLQPIYVFEGRITDSNNSNGDIVIYFPAIRGDFIKAE